MTDSEQLSFYQGVLRYGDATGEDHNGELGNYLFSKFNLTEESYKKLDLAALYKEAQEYINNSSSYLKKCFTTESAYEQFYSKAKTNGTLSDLYSSIAAASNEQDIRSILYSYIGALDYNGSSLNSSDFVNLQKEAENYINNAYADGILSSLGGLSMINEMGTEAIVTPNGTITSLPSHSGIIPADITKNLWSLGEIAPNILRAVETYSNTISGTSNGGQNITNDDSFNISNLTMNVDASGDFDVNEFVTSIKNRVALSKNSH